MAARAAAFARNSLSTAAGRRPAIMRARCRAAQSMWRSANRMRLGLRAAAGNRDAQIAVGPDAHHVAARPPHPDEVDADRLRLASASGSA